MSTRILINDGWQFTTQAVAAADLASVKDVEQVDVPHTWNALDGQDGGDDYHRGLCWYTREILRPAVPEGGRIYLECEAVNSVANAYVNGTHVGEHRGGYSTFRFDITEALTDGKNLIAISADNTHREDVYPLYADFTFYGGIYRDVSLVAANPLHFDLTDFGSSGVYVSQVDVQTARAELEVRALVRSTTGAKSAEVNVQLLDADGAVVTEARSSADVSVKGTITVALAIDAPRLWSPSDPYLYTCRVELVDRSAATGDAAAPVDSIDIPTGLRFFSFDGEKGFILNGTPTRLNGVSRHQDREGVGNALTREHQVEDMELIRELGANSIRLAHYQHSSFFYDLCDQNGMVVWAEIPYISRTGQVDNYAENPTSQMHELIRQNYNHASIVMWGVQNEIGIFPDERPLHETVKEIAAVAKADDPYRPTTQAQVMLIQEDDPANDETDVVAFNQYHGWYVGNTSGYDGFIQRHRASHPKRPFAYSEYGAEGIITLHSDDPKVKDYSEEYHAKYHEEVMATFLKYDFIWGTYVWNMFDFGSDMRDEGGVKGRNNKGLVTFDRTVKKDAFFLYQSLWSEKPMVHIASKRFVNRHTDAIAVKVYSNQESVTLEHNGRVVGTETASGLPTVFRFTVELDAGENTVVARAGAVQDTTRFVKVAEPDANYVLPEEERGKGLLDFDTDTNVQNWFDQPVEGEMEFPEGYFSIKDKIQDIIANPEGEAIMREHFGALLENKRFGMAKRFPFEMVIGFKPDAFPAALVKVVNDRLNKVKK